MLRYALFFATNMAILVLATVVLSLFGVSPSRLPGLWILGACVGFGGALISLWSSKAIAKWSMGLEVIDPVAPGSSDRAWLVQVVHRQAEQAGIKAPEVAIWPSDDVNAFATGPTRNSALVAVSTGLLANMRKDEVEAVLAHEVSHAANGDMVTMALLQGVLNTFVFVIARVLADRLGGTYRLLAIIALEIGLGLLASTIAMWFSRRREFRADAGAANLVGRHKMIAALRALSRDRQPPQLPDTLAAFGMRGEAHPTGWRKLFLSHPPLEDRIAALELHSRTVS